MFFLFHFTPCDTHGAFEKPNIFLKLIPSNKDFCIKLSLCATLLTFNTFFTSYSLSQSLSSWLKGWKTIHTASTVPWILRFLRHARTEETPRRIWCRSESTHLSCVRNTAPGGRNQMLVRARWRAPSRSLTSEASAGDPPPHSQPQPDAEDIPLPYQPPLSSSPPSSSLKVIQSWTTPLLSTPKPQRGTEWQV